jgi:hypothetical protein
MKISMTNCQTATDQWYPGTKMADQVELQSKLPEFAEGTVAMYV